MQNSEKKLNKKIYFKISSFLNIFICL